MWTSKVFLRWYKSFNTRYHGYVEEHTKQRPWELRGAEFFPFVEVPLERRISTIVGANESGKSHLLSTLEKLFNSRSSTDNGFEDYDIQHLCRYCALDALSKEVWPNIGVQLSFADADDYLKCRAALGAPTTAAPAGITDFRLAAFIDGGRKETGFGSVYDHADNLLCNFGEDAWRDFASLEQLPTVHFINSKLALSNEVHVQQLLDMYVGQAPSSAYDPLALQELAASLLSLQLQKGKVIEDSEIAEISKVRTNLAGRTMGPKDSAKLETLLFHDILDIEQPTLERIKSLGATNRGFVERLLEEVNHRLIETLDLSSFWQQDEEFTLQLEYKGGFFYFLITDKTGAKYTFNERSSGLRYFLSYYIQLKAFRRQAARRGAIILMDEPDSFLSAAAQKNLLQVFEAIVDVPKNHGEVQLIYTTHSPFMVNRNYPKRISLLRKGDGSEGTQLVEGIATRRFEPVRSGLGIDCGETLFFGALNVVVEGTSEQKVIVAAVQRFGDPARVDEMLDLNKVTFVSAGGVFSVPGLVQRSTSGAEKRPIVVALLDGDAPGQQIAQQLDATGLLESDAIATLDQVGLVPSWNPSPRELDDVIPPAMLANALSRYIHDRWESTMDPNVCLAALQDQANGDTMAKRIVSAVRNETGAATRDVADIELKGGVYDAFVDILLNTREFDANPFRQNLVDLQTNMRAICRKLQTLLRAAEIRSRRDRLQKNVRLAVERFEKAHRDGATKADVDRCLQRIDDACIGSTDSARRARENVIQLRDILDGEVDKSGELVKIEPWLERFRKLWESPWKEQRSGWK